MLKRPAFSMWTAILLALFFTDAARARLVTVTVIHTTDLHGNIWPARDYDERADLGGILRCATRIEQIRAEHPDALLIDAGDTYQGSPESFLTGGSLMIDALNELKYDAWVLGNHEIDWGPASLRRLHDLAAVPFLAGNLYFLDAGDNWLPRIKSHVIREIDGIKVAIIGLTTPGIPRWSRPHLLDKAMFKRSVESLGEIMPEVRAQKPDVIIAAVHQGHRKRGDDFANEVEAIAANFPEIDLLIGGHTHIPVEDMRLNGVLYTQAGYHGIWLGHAQLVFDTVEKRVIEKKGRLDLMDASVALHPGLQAKWADQLASARTALDEVMGHVPVRLDPKPDEIGRSPMQQMICRAISAGAGVDMVLHGSLGDEALEPGPMRVRDVWRAVPYENTIGILQLTPSEIERVLVQNHSRPLTSHSLGPYGFSYRVDRTNPTNVIISEMRDAEGSPLHPRKRYPIAFNSYTLASGGERYLALRELADRPESRLQMIEGDTRSMVRQYLQNEMLVGAEAGAGTTP